MRGERREEPSEVQVELIAHLGGAPEGELHGCEGGEGVEDEGSCRFEIPAGDGDLNLLRLDVPVVEEREEEREGRGARRRLVAFP